jgi:hypothetical protein
VKKTIVTIPVFLFPILLGCRVASANETINTKKLSLGYQGVFAGDFLQGVSSRYWFSTKIGAELNAFYGTGGIDYKDSGITDYKGKLLVTTAKFLYAPVIKEHSRFYVGVESGIGSLWADRENEDDGFKDKYNVTVFAIGPLIGSEFTFSEIPELGFNWEVGYKYTGVSTKFSGDDADVSLSGTFASLGVHYYF